ncbi:hypothetical protein HMI56_003811 [Coelomomyces lativittatus]|nr:hypothetical protein HMI56_003811 [Coelomomyces lativittatus]
MFFKLITFHKLALLVLIVLMVASTTSLPSPQSQLVFEGGADDGQTLEDPPIGPGTSGFLSQVPQAPINTNLVQPGGANVFVPFVASPTLNSQVIL